jgi:hypothetical protein
MEQLRHSCAHNAKPACKVKTGTRPDIVGFAPCAGSADNVADRMLEKVANPMIAVTEAPVEFVLGQFPRIAVSNLPKRESPKQVSVHVYLH